MKKKGTVYLLADTSENGIYKIGVTRGSVKWRIDKLQTGNPDEIYVMKKYETFHPFFIENSLHFKYANKQVLNEWYELTQEEVDNFINDCEKIEKNIETLKNNPFFKYDKIK